MSVPLSAPFREGEIPFQRLTTFVTFVIFCSISRFKIWTKAKSTCHEFDVRPVNVKGDYTLS